MTNQLSKNTIARTLLSALVVYCIFTVTSHAPLAQTPVKNYEVELVVSQGKKSVETDAVLGFKETTFSVVPDKASFQSATKELAYGDIKTADYSFAKKPMLSGGGAIATAILVGLFVLPFLFMKKKK